MDNDCSVMLTGDLVAGSDPEEVKQTLAGLFKISLQEVDALLAKAPVRIKQNVDAQTAQRYRAAVEKSGALCEVVTPPMDLEDTIPPGGAPDLAGALSAAAQPAADADADADAVEDPPPDVYAPPAASLDYEEDYTPTLSEPHRVGAGRGWAWLAAGFRSFGANPLQWLGILVVWIVIVIVSSFVPLAFNVLQPIFIGGLMLGLLRQDNGEDIEFQDLFGGFQEHGGKLALVGIITVAAYIVMAIIVGIIAFVFGAGSLAALDSMSDPNQIPIAGIVGIVVITVLAVTAMMLIVMAAWFAPALIVFHDVELMDAFKLSFVGCLRNWLSFLVVYGCITVLLFVAGAFTLGLAYFVIGPAFMASVYFSYKDIYTD